LRAGLLLERNLNRCHQLGRIRLRTGVKARHRIAVAANPIPAEVPRQFAAGFGVPFGVREKLVKRNLILAGE